jgi:hypothetical protein
VTAEFIAATISIYVILSSPAGGPKLAVLILFFVPGGCSQQGDYKWTEIVIKEFP